MTADAVVVTGASTGIGRAIALHLDSLGLRVFAGIRREQDGAALQSAAAGPLTPLQLDVTDPDQIAAAGRSVADALGGDRLIGVASNAGIAIPGPFELITLDQWRRQLEVNVLGVVAVIQAFLPQLRLSAGRIVITGSMGGRISQPMAAPYCASKYALEAIADALRLELRPWGIRTAILEPGAVTTPIWGKGAETAEAMLRSAPPGMVQLYGRAVEIFRTTAERENQQGISPDEVARAAAHALLSPRPRTRYPLGRQARLGIPLTRFLPDRVRDALLLRLSGLPRQAEDTAPSAPPEVRAHGT